MLASGWPGPASERPEPAPERPEPASKSHELASERPEPASKRLEPVSDRPGPASDRPGSVWGAWGGGQIYRWMYGQMGHTDSPCILPYFVPSGSLWAAAQKALRNNPVSRVCWFHWATKILGDTVFHACSYPIHKCGSGFRCK